MDFSGRSPSCSSGGAFAAHVAGNQASVLTGLSLLLALVGLVSGGTDAKTRPMETVILSLALVGQAMLLNAALAGHPCKLTAT